MGCFLSLKFALYFFKLFLGVVVALSGLLVHMYDRGPVKRRGWFLRVVVFVIAVSFLLPPQLSFPKFVDQLVIISQVSQRLFQFAFEYLVAEVVLFQLSQVGILPLQLGH